MKQATLLLCGKALENLRQGVIQEMRDTTDISKIEDLAIQIIRIREAAKDLETVRTNG